MGKTVITCCGIVLPELEAEEVNDTHKINIKNIEDELLIRINHEMYEMRTMWGRLFLGIGYGKD